MQSPLKYYTKWDINTDDTDEIRRNTTCDCFNIIYHHGYKSSL